MITSMGFHIVTFSVFMVLMSLSALTMSHLWRPLRAPARRMLMVFGITAISGTYIWLEAGPVVDYRLNANDPAPTLLVRPQVEMNA